LKFFQQTLIEKFPAGFDFEISNAIVIAIEKLIRIDRTLIDPGRKPRTFLESPVSWFFGSGVIAVCRSAGLIPVGWS
jgi:hypothetical protein